MSIRSYEEPIAPTVEAIDTWRRQGGPSRKAGDDTYGVNIWTKASRMRCIFGRQEHAGFVWYWTIRGEGSSNGSREYAIRADQIVRAEGWIVGDDAPGHDPRLQEGRR